MAWHRFRLLFSLAAGGSLGVQDTLPIYAACISTFETVQARFVRLVCERDACPTTIADSQ